MRHGTRNREGGHTLIAPLRKRYPNGTSYFRPQIIEQSLAALDLLSIDEVAERAKIDDSKDRDYVSSECVLHFVRQSKARGDGNAYFDLFTILRQRVLQAVPVIPRRVSGLSKSAEKGSDLDVQEHVIQAFQKLICSDRNEYDERLDFYEIRFKKAVARLRASARRSVRKHTSRLENMTYEDDSTTPSAEVEEALARLKGPGGDEKLDFLYRSRLLAAINALPPDERRVIELCLQDMDIESEDGEALTMVKVLKCVEKTVRNRRDRAFAKLRETLQKEEVA